MAKLVLIDNGTYVNGVNNVGDLVSVHNDDVELSGPGYATFKIVSIDGTADNVLKNLASILPKVEIVYKSDTEAGKWTFDRPTEKKVWNDNGIWRDIKVEPKYTINLVGGKATSNLVSNENNKEAVIDLSIEKVG
jgi:hypothetical protein